MIFQAVNFWDFLLCVTSKPLTYVWAAHQSAGPWETLKIKAKPSCSPLIIARSHDIVCNFPFYFHFFLFYFSQWCATRLCPQTCLSDVALGYFVKRILWNIKKKKRLGWWFDVVVGWLVGWLAGWLLSPLKNISKIPCYIRWTQIFFRTLVLQH